MGKTVIVYKVLNTPLNYMKRKCRNRSTKMASNFIGDFINFLEKYFLILDYPPPKKRKLHNLKSLELEMNPNLSIIRIRTLYY